jgi:hypothetical protein
MPSQWKVVVLFDPDAARMERWPEEYARDADEGVTLLVFSSWERAGWESGNKDWSASYGGNCCIVATKFHP